MKNIFVLALLFISFGCARAPIKDRTESMRVTRSTPVLEDDLAYEGMENVLRTTIEVFNRKLSDATEVCQLQFGPDVISCAEYKNFLDELLVTFETDPSGALFSKTIKEKAEFREVFGGAHWGDVFITSYYQPIILGSRKKTTEYSQALYRRPDDLLNIDMGRFATEFKNLREFHQKAILEKSRDGFLRGRIEKDENGVSRVVPYYSRAEIEVKNVFKNKDNEIVWVRPVDAFFLQIQGSGIVQITEPLIGPTRNIAESQQQILVGYADQNGHPYFPIGKALLDKIPIQEMSMQRIQAELNKLGPKLSRQIMNMNPSYVFFQQMDTEPQTAFTAPPTPGRTIATDIKYFPKGGLAFLEYEKPVISDLPTENTMMPNVTVAMTTKKSSRFVIDQDVGGAIRGPGRVDLFWGRGDEAEKISGLMRHPGRLFYLAPKKKND
jgi:membrane-bound lytic murein transglycosylase A